MSETFEDVADRLDEEVPEDFWDDEEAYENKMRELAVSENPMVRRWVAGNYWVPKETRDMLMKDPDPDVRGAALDAVNVHPDQEEALDDEFDAVMAAHKKDPEAGYRKLAASPMAAHRLSVVARGTIPQDVADRMLEDPVETVRYNVASNFSVSVEALEALFERGDTSQVISAALSNHKVGAERLRRMFDTVEDRYGLVMIARNPNAPADLLHMIAEEPAENYELPVYQKSAYTNLVANPNVRQDTIDLMLNHSDKEVVKAVQKAVEHRKEYGHSENEDW